MKKLIWMAFLMVGMSVLAQERNRKPLREEIEQFTSEQKNQLMLKKLTLELDLNDSQQKEMKDFLTDKTVKMEAQRTAMKEMREMREKGTKPTNDERFNMKMKMLDEQIATKKRIEKILNPKQFEKWNELKEKHMGDRQAKHQQNHRGGYKEHQRGGQREDQSRRG